MTAQNRDLVLSDKELQRIEEGAEKAAAGPWKLWGMSVLADPIGDSNLDTALPVADTTDTRYPAPRTFNAQFIADARSDVPALVAEVRRLRSVEQRVLAVCEGFSSVRVSVIQQTIDGEK